MSCFDGTMAYYDPSSPRRRTYKSYMCPSRDSYSLKDRGRMRVDKFHYPWSNASRDQFFDNKPPHISKLRNILSETISNITKESNLKGGKSVELTLEIELVKDPLTSPTNSLVEVTIIQHKPEENNSIKADSEQTLENKNIYQVDRNSSFSDCPSQKRRNWFNRVIKRYYYKSPKNNSSEEFYKRIVQNRRAQIDSITNKNTADISTKKFINILPEDKAFSGVSKGYRRVSPGKKTLKDSPPGKRSLVNKISEMFLPTMKQDKNIAIKSALSDLKKEVEHMKSVAEKESKDNKKKKNPPLPKLGKLVNNILTDVIENCTELDSNGQGTYPIHYQSFYEPVETKKKKKDPINAVESKNMSRLSRSDTHLAASISEPIVKSSRSVNDCNEMISCTRKQMTQCEGIGDSMRLSLKNKQINYIKKKSRHSLNRNEKGDGKRQKRHKVNSKHRIRKSKRNKTVNKKCSAIEWNGRMYEVNKEVKLRIEKIIVNELQNLALKEGMECDVSSLPSTESSVNNFKPMDKISSFICELDISDEKFPKGKSQKRTNLKRNASYVIEKKRSSKALRRTSKKTSQRVNAGSTPDSTSSPEQAFENGLRPAITELSTSKSARECPAETNDFKERPMASEKQDVTQDGFEIKYINTNRCNWSEESVGNNRSDIKGSDKPTAQNNKELDTDLSGLTFKHLSSGFVKRIDSNDSTWNDVPRGPDVITTNETKTNKVLTQSTKTDSTRKTAMVNSTTSNESEKNIQIELDLKDLETILNEAKNKQDSGKIVLNATCKHGTKKNIRSRGFTGKNSTSYTDHLLIKAAQKLEKYRRMKI